MRNSNIEDAALNSAPLGLKMMKNKMAAKNLKIPISRHLIGLKG